MKLLDRTIRAIENDAVARADQNAKDAYKTGLRDSSRGVVAAAWELSEALQEFWMDPSAANKHSLAVAQAGFRATAARRDSR